MRIFMPHYRPWTFAAEVAFLLLLMATAATEAFTGRHTWLGWFTVFFGLLLLLAARSKWRRERRLWRRGRSA